LTPRIAIDASRCTRAQRTGTEQYALALLRALIPQNHEFQLSLYFREEPAPDLLPSSSRVAMRVLRSPRLWTHLPLAAALYRDRPALTFVPAHTLPWRFPGRAIVTIHDLGYRHFPAAHPLRQRLYLDWSTRHSARRADLLLCDSEATKADAAHFYGTPAAKMRVVYPGVNPLSGEMDAAAVAAIRAKHGLPARYYLHVGTLQPRKNIAFLVATFQRWAAERADAAVVLALAGRKGWLFDESWLGAGRQVRWLGYVDDADLATLYRGARALLLPALHEGFGFPALEAMRCGTPVLASNRASLPEVVGEAGILLDPQDETAWVQTLTAIENDEALRQKLIARGTEQARQFRWEETAQQTLAAFREVLQGTGGA